MNTKTKNKPNSIRRHLNFEKHSNAEEQKLNYKPRVAEVNQKHIDERKQKLSKSRSQQKKPIEIGRYSKNYLTKQNNLKPKQVDGERDNKNNPLHKQQKFHLAAQKKQKDQMKTRDQTKKLSSTKQHKGINAPREIEDKHEALGNQKQLIQSCQAIFASIQSYQNKIDIRDIINEIHSDRKLLENGKIDGKNINRIIKIFNPILLRLVTFFEEKSEKLENENANLRRNQTLLARPANNEENSRLFLCRILYDREDSQNFLNDVLSSTFGSIQKTLLLYKYDPYNKANLHSYIDRKKHLLFIIKTQNNSIISAYTQSAFQPMANPTGRGFIFSLTNNKLFSKIPDRRPISYDQLYVIFGNSDLRINRNEVFSNLGVSNGCYDSKGERVDSLFGEGNKNTTTLKELQVFEVIY